MRSMNAISASPPPSSVVWNKNKSIGVPSRDWLCVEIGRSPITLISRNAGLATTTPPAGVSWAAGLLRERPRPATVLGRGVVGEFIRTVRETGVGVGAGRPEPPLLDSRSGDEARAARMRHVEPVFDADAVELIQVIPVCGRRCRFGFLPFSVSTTALPRRGFAGTLLSRCGPHLLFEPGLGRDPDP